MLTIWTLLSVYKQVLIIIIIHHQHIYYLGAQFYNNEFSFLYKQFMKTSFFELEMLITVKYKYVGQKVSTKYSTVSSIQYRMCQGVKHEANPLSY